MAKSKKRKSPFTVAGLDNMKAKGGRLEISEPSGLRIVIGSLRKTFFFRFLSPVTGQHRNMKLGNYPELSLKDARTKVAAAKELIGQKVDPMEVDLEAKLELSEAPTVEDIVEDYMARVASKKKSSKEIQRYLEKGLIPRLGKFKVGTVERRQVVAMIDNKAESAPVAARNLLTYTRLVFAHALERGHIQANPCTDIKPPATAKARQRILTDDEIKQFWQGVDALNASQQAKDILHLCLITAQRSGEIRQMKWADIDGAWWTIPEGVTKNKLAHRVPLTPMAMAIIEKARTSAEGEAYVFPGKYPDQPLGRNSPDQAIRRGADSINLDDFTVHDLRRTAASGMAGLGTPRLVVGQVLNHAERGVTAVYDRHSYDPEKQQALGQWDTKLQAILKGDQDDDEIPEILLALMARLEADPSLNEHMVALEECEAAFEADPWDGFNVLLAIDYCQQLRMPVVDWAYRAFDKAVAKWQLGEVRTLDEALGLTPQPRNPIKKAMEQWKIWSVTNALIKAGGKQPQVFKKAAKVLGNDHGIYYGHESVKKIFLKLRKEVRSANPDEKCDNAAIGKMISERRKAESKA